MKPQLLLPPSSMVVALEEDGSDNWGTIFLPNYFSSCQHLGQTFSQPKAFYIGYILHICRYTSKTYKIVNGIIDTWWSINRLKLKPVPGSPRIWETAGPQASHSPPTHSITTPFPLYPLLHLTLSTRTFITKCYFGFYLNHPFLFC